MLDQEDFKPVRLEDRAFFENHYASYPQIHSSNMFTNMVCWNHFAHYRYTYVNKNVIISSTIRGVTRFHSPIGPHDPTLMRALVRLALYVGDDTPLVLIDPDTARWLQKIDPNLMLVPDRNHFDYVYKATDLAELPGKNYVKIRNHIRKFWNNYSHTIENITARDNEKIMSFLVKWREWKGCENDSFLSHEIEAAAYAIEHLAELPLKGRLIRVNSQVGAISLFERLNADTAVVHFEKGLPEYNGIYKAISKDTAMVLAGEVKYINRESDLGVSGLREAKIRYHPHHMVKVYSLKR